MTSDDSIIYNSIRFRFLIKSNNNFIKNKIKQNKKCNTIKETLLVVISTILSNVKIN